MESSAVQKFEDLATAFADELNGVFFRCKNDELWTLEYISPGVENLLGFTQSEILANKRYAPGNLILPLDAERVKQEILNRAGKEDKLTLEYRVRTKSGKIKWIREVNIPVVESGKIVFFEGYIRDVSLQYYSVQNSNIYEDTLELLADGEPLDYILNRLIEAIEKEFDGCFASTLQLRGEKLYPVASNKLPKEYNDALEGLTPGENVGACGRAITLKERVVHQDIQNHPNWSEIHDILKRAGLQSCWSEPIISSAGEAMGTFALYWKYKRKPHELDLRKLRGIVHLAGIAMEKKSREEERQSFLTMLDVQSLNEMYLINPNNGKIEYANSGALNNLGYSLAELKNATVNILNPGYTHRSLIERVKKMESSGKNHFFFETQHSAKNGNIYPVEVNLQKITWKGEVFFLVNALDISAKLETHRKLEESQAVLSKAEKMAGLGSFRYHPERKEMRCSANFFDLFGAKNTIGNNTILLDEFSQLLTEKYAQRFKTAIDKTVKTGEGVAVKLKHRNKNSIGYFDIVLRYEISSVIGESAFFVSGIVKDVTESVLSEKETLRLSGILNAIFNNTDHGIFIKDQKGCYTYANKAYARIHNKMPEEMKGISDFDIEPTEVAQKYSETDQKVLNTLKSMTFDSVRKDNSGKNIYYRITKGPLLIDRKPKGVYAIMENITSEKEASKLLEDQNGKLQTINKELGHLVTHTSHDLRSPLASIKGLISLCEGKYPQDEELSELFTLMKLSLEKSNALINSILNLAKGDVLQVSKVKCNPAEIARDHFESIRYIPEAQDVRFEVKQEGTPEVIIDKVRLTAILGNLITNSAKYTHPDEPDKFIEVVIKNLGRTLNIRVNDNGIGIPVEKRDEIFEVFKRNSSREDGVGLGLYIVSRMIQSLNGKIQVESMRPRGTSMHVEIPLSTEKA